MAQRRSAELVRSRYSNVLKPWVIALPALNRLWEDVTRQSGPLCYVRFRMFSMGRREFTGDFR
jgi:hypothetical protein